MFRHQIVNFQYYGSYFPVKAQGRTGCPVTLDIGVVYYDRVNTLGILK